MEQTNCKAPVRADRNQTNITKERFRNLMGVIVSLLVASSTSASLTSAIMLQMSAVEAVTTTPVRKVATSSLEAIAQRNTVVSMIPAEPAVNTKVSQTSESSLAETQSTATERLQLPVPQFTVVARLPRFGEGVVFDREGRLYVSDSFDNSILRISETGEAQVWARVFSPNGHKVLANGIHVVLEQGEQGGAVAYLDPDGQVIQRITTDDPGRRLRYPNDIALDLQNGGFYFTDPGLFMANEPGRVYYVDVQGSIRTVSDNGIDFSNGIVLRPDGQTLLVGESLQNRVLEFRVPSPGRIERSRVFATLPSQPNPWTNGEAEPDGMTLDESGNLYVAHFGAGVVRVFDPSGRLLGSLGSGTATITNLAFGGPDLNELYIYGANGTSLEEVEDARIVRLTLPGVRGLPLFPPAGELTGQNTHGNAGSRSTRYARSQHSF